MKIPPNVKYADKNVFDLSGPIKMSRCIQKGALDGITNGYTDRCGI